MDPQSIINSVFQQYLGRQPTPSEMQGFSSAIQSGVLDPTGLSLFLQGSSQYQQAQIPGQTSQYQNTLQQGNQNILQQGMNQAQQMFAQNGRQNSTGLSSAYAQVAGNLAAQQSPQVANFQGQLQQNALNPNQYGQQYLGNQQNYQNQQFQQSQAVQQNNWYQQALGQNFAQQNKNNLYQLGGSLLGGVGQGGGMALGKALF